MAIRPPAAPAYPVEAKVKAATASAGGSAAVLTAVLYPLLGAIWPGMDQPTKVAITAVITALATAATTFYAGYRARHTSRAGTSSRLPPPAAHPYPPA
jgi:hypothetical protein